MNISVLGNGHLGYITAAGMECHHKVNVNPYKIASSDIIWFCHDIPVNDNGEPDNDYIKNEVTNLIKVNELKPGTLFLISSQSRVGICKELSVMFPQFDFAYSPENLRRGQALRTFLNPKRIIVGCNVKNKIQIFELLKPLNTEIIWMSVESAEMVKHALNTFLALSIAYINEIDKVCRVTGADSKDVALGLQSDERIGLLSYLKPGDPFPNETLGREVFNLTNLSKQYNLNLNLIPTILESNEAHRNNR